MKYLVLFFVCCFSSICMSQNAITCAGETSSDGTLTYTIGDSFTFLSTESDAGFLSEVDDKIIESNIIDDCVKSIEVFDNKLKSEIWIRMKESCDLSNFHFSVYTLSGMCIYRKQIFVPEFSINYSDYPSGMLLLNFNINNAIFKTIKFVN